MTLTMSLADMFSKAYENREVSKSFEAPMWLQSAIIHKQNEPKNTYTYRVFSRLAACWEVARRDGWHFRLVFNIPTNPFH